MKLLPVGAVTSLLPLAVNAGELTVRSLATARSSNVLVLSALRVFAVLDRNKSLAVIVAVLGMIPLGINAVRSWIMVPESLP